MKKLALGVAALGAIHSSVEGSCFDGVYVGAGFGYCFSENSAEINGTAGDVSKKANNLLETMFLGSGKTTNAHPLYLGGEIAIDFTKTRREDIHLGGRPMQMRNNGVIPSFSFRIGYASKDSSSIFFAKIGLAHVKVTLNNDVEPIKTSKLAPSFGIGIEKILCGNCSSRFDLGYRMKTDKTGNRYKVESGHGLSLRFGLAYNIKF